MCTGTLDITLTDVGGEDVVPSPQVITVDTRLIYYVSCAACGLLFPDNDAATPEEAATDAYIYGARYFAGGAEDDAGTYCLGCYEEIEERVKGERT